MLNYIKRLLSKILDVPVYKGKGVTIDDSTQIPEDFDITKLVVDKEPLPEVKVTFKDPGHSVNINFPSIGQMYIFIQDDATYLVSSITRKTDTEDFSLDSLTFTMRRLDNTETKRVCYSDLYKLFKKVGF